MTFKKLRFLGRGKRSEVYVFKKNNKLYCIKFKRKDSKAVGRLENEAKFLILLNKYKIGPKLIAYGSDFIVYEFVNGNFFIDYLQRSKNPLKIIKQIFAQCFIMDKLGINKEEMHRPLKHIIVFRNFVKMIDFERCHYSDKVHNVTQFFQFLYSRKEELQKKGINLKINYKQLQKYKKEINEKKYKDLIQTSLSSNHK